MRKFREAEGRSIVVVKNALFSASEYSITSMVAKMSGHWPKDSSLQLYHSGLNSLDVLHLRSSMAKHYDFALGLTDFWLTESIRSPAQCMQKKIKVINYN
jgi:hypothetical protein